MTTTEHLEKIKARCLANLALAKKRTPGEYTAEACYVDADAVQVVTCVGRNANRNAAYIAACAGAAEAGWKTTVATIDTCLPITEENLPLVRSTIAAWPEDSL